MRGNDGGNRLGHALILIDECEGTMMDRVLDLMKFRVF
jgi:hypothetical protein